MKLCGIFAVVAVTLVFQACAGERQGLVCSEIQYRLDTQTYSPDQRAYIENELNECRAEEAKKRGADSVWRQGIYERYAATNKADSASADSGSSVISVSKALEDSSQPLAIYQFSNHRIETLLVSDGFCRLFGYPDRAEAIYLLDHEMYKNVHKTFHITIGRPIPWQTFDKSKSPKEWAQFVREQVYQL